MNKAKDMVGALPEAPFWMVLGEGVPVYRHACRSDAEREARRLAKRHGGVFVVLEAVSATVRSEFNTVTFRSAVPAAPSLFEQALQTMQMGN